MTTSNGLPFCDINVLGCTINFLCCLFIPGDLSSNDGFVDMPEIGGPQTPSQHGTYAGSGSPYAVGSHDASGGGVASGGGGSSGIHHFPHFTPDGIPVYPPIG